MVTTARMVLGVPEVPWESNRNSLGFGHADLVTGNKLSSTTMPIPFLDRLEAWKTRFGERDAAPLERLLATAAKSRMRDAASLIRLHETVLFLRAWPPTP